MKNDEKVLCVINQEIPKDWLSNRIAIKIPEKKLETSICHWDWIKRSTAEKDPSYKQLIPYAVIQDLSGNIGCYRRCGSEERLHGLWSLGVGGHINPEDSTSEAGKGSISGVIRNALFREIHEEFHIIQQNFEANFAGIIHENESEVGLVHLGVVFSCTIENTEELVPAEELSEFTWYSRVQLEHQQLELWSELALRLV